MIARLFGGIEALLDLVSTILLGIALAAVAVQVVMRYVFNDATTWSDTLAAASLAWLTFLGTASAVRKDGNIAVRSLCDRLGPAGRRWLLTLCHLAVLLFALMLLYSGWLLVALNRNTHVEGLVLPVSWAQLYAVVPASAALMVLFSAEWIVRLWRSAPP
jgi:TRAP-type C4-dicarboxylate transport system permease small subunit